MNEELEGAGAPDEGAPADQHAEQGQPQPGAPSDDPNLRRPRRRGRRGRGSAQPLRAPPAAGFRPPQPGGFRPQQPGGFRPAPPFRGPPRGPLAPRPAQDDEASLQARELAAYERRQQQQQRRTTGGWRPGAPFRAPSAGGPRRFGAGSGPRYDEQIRRATSGPARGAAPSHEAGEPIAGPHAVLEALRAGRVIRKLYISQDRGVRTGSVNELIIEAQEHHVFVNYLDKLDIARLSPIENHQGVVAIVEGRAGVELDELLLHVEAVSEPALVLVVDSLQDPQNFGVLLRSAEGAGVDGVVIPRHRAVGLTPAVAKTSAGASEHLMVADVANLRQAIDALKEKGLWVVGTDESGDLLYDEVDYRGATALVIGGEGEGIRRLVLEGCDQVVRIPMEGRIASLNAAAAGTVVLYEALRQRRRNAAPPGTHTPRPEPAEGAESDELADTPDLEADEAELEVGELDAIGETDDLAAEDGAPDRPDQPDEAEADVAVTPAARKRAAAVKKPTTRKAPKKTAED